MYDTVPLAVGWIQTSTGIGNDIKTLIFDVAIPVMCGVFVVVIGFKTKAPGPTIIAVILAGIVWGGSANMDTLRDKTTEDITQYDGGGGTLTGPGDQ